MWTMSINQLICKLADTVSWSVDGCWSSVDLDSPSQHEVAGSTKDDEERAESDEINVEVCVFHVQFLEDIVTFLKDASTLTVLLTLEWFSVVAIDCLQDSLK